MIDIFNLADNALKSQVFYPVSSASTQWQTWQKPRGAKFVNILCIGSGGGGCGGVSGSSTRGVGGGGGGGSKLVGEIGC